MEFNLTSVQGKEYFANSQEPEPEPEPLEKKILGAEAGSGAAWEKIRSRSRAAKKFAGSPALKKPHKM